MAATPAQWACCGDALDELADRAGRPLGVDRLGRLDEGLAVDGVDLHALALQLGDQLLVGLLRELALRLRSPRRRLR